MPPQSALIRMQAEQRVQRVNLHLALGGSFEASAVTRPVDDLEHLLRSERHRNASKASPRQRRG